MKELADLVRAAVEYGRYARSAVGTDLPNVLADLNDKAEFLAYLGDRSACAHNVYFREAQIARACVLWDRASNG